jgi:hypothetical protein
MDENLISGHDMRLLYFPTPTKELFQQTLFKVVKLKPKINHPLVK